MPVGLETIEECRSRRRLLDPEQLVALLMEPCADLDLRAQVAAELVARAWLMSAGPAESRSQMAEYVERGLSALGCSKNVIEATCGWCKAQAQKRSFILPSLLSSENSLLWRLVTYDLNNWRDAQGFVLFIPQNGIGNHGLAREGVALPFIFDESVSERGALLRSADDSAIEDDLLNRAIRTAHAVARKQEWLREDQRPALKLTTLRGAFDSSCLTGESLGLAALLAMALCHAKLYRTQVGPFLFGTSGTIGENGCSIPGAHGEEDYLKKERLLSMMGVRHRLLPAGPQYRYADTTSLPTAAIPEFLIRKLSVLTRDEKISELPALVSLADIELRLGKVERGMRFGSTSAPVAKSECETILKKVGDATSVRASDLRLLAKANLAAAECHLGHSERSSDLCHQIMEDPACGARFKIQAMVRQVVNLTDMCRYEDAVRIGREAHQLLDRLGSATDRLDMELQLTGSIGQALCYWALIDPKQSGEAFELLEKSCQLARQLDEDAPTDTTNLPRNLCYWYLAHALLKPTEAEEVYQQVADTCLGDSKTRAYFLRARWVSAYRMLLLGIDLPASLAKLDMEMPDPTAEGGWVNQTAAKYRGALRAAIGDVEGACEDFTVAAKLVECGSTSPLLEFIGGTACLQAGDSLCESRSEIASKYFQVATDVFLTYSNWFAGEISGLNWLAESKQLLRKERALETTDLRRHFPY